MTPTGELTVASVQMVPEVGDLAENLRRTVSATKRAVQSGARLVVFPELSLTGYDLELLHASDVWFSPGDRRLEQLRQVAAASGATVVVGAPVKIGGHKHIASLVLTGGGPDVFAPKTHLHGAEADVVEPGDGPVIVECAGWCVGLAVCYDTAFSEHARAARDAGAHLYAASVLYTAGEERKLDVRMAARAVDHGVWTLAANLGGRPSGKRSAGGSGVWSPDGSATVAAAGQDDDAVFATLDPAKLR
jgi:5-aminopentanamidase